MKPTKLKEKNKLQSKGNFTLGSSTVVCDFPGTIGTYYIDVTYDMYATESGQYTLKPIYDTINAAIIIIVGALGVPAGVASALISSLLAWGLGKMIDGYFDSKAMRLNADKNDYVVYGEDKNDPYATGELYGTRWRITHVGEYYSDIYYSGGAHLDDWGNKRITYGLIEQMYPTLYTSMIVESEK